MGKKNELEKAAESIGETIRANANSHIFLAMDEAHQAVPSSKEKAEHMKKLRREYSGSLKATDRDTSR